MLNIAKQCKRLKFQRCATTIKTIKNGNPTSTCQKNNLKPKSEQMQLPLAYGNKYMNVCFHINLDIQRAKCAAWAALNPPARSTLRQLNKTSPRQ